MYIYLQLDLKFFHLKIIGSEKIRAYILYI